MRFGEGGSVERQKRAKIAAAEPEPEPEPEPEMRFESSVSAETVIDRLVVEIVFVTIGHQTCQAHRRLA